MDKHKYYMNEAYKEALKAYNKQEVPVGCVIVYQGEIIARAHNNRENLQSVLGHAEILAIDIATKKLNTWRLEEATLYVTLEPCPMCAGAIIQSRIKHCYYASKDLKSGVAHSIINMFDLPFNHKVIVEQIDDDNKSSLLLKKFFQELRKNK